LAVKLYGERVKLQPKRFEGEMIQGWLHEPTTSNGDAIGLTHGAGSNCDAPLLCALAEAFCDTGLYVLRFDLPYRQQRPKGSPFPAQAARDREGIARAADAVRSFATRRLFLGGHSYGGRQITMLAAESPLAVDGLLILSYPLHPPGKPQDPRTGHFSKLGIATMFAHGTRDPFGSEEEMRAALTLIPARHELVIKEGAPHGIPPSFAKTLTARFADFISVNGRPTR
jgi:predicted alpha/beta-hydrolase family hydrolase